MKQHRKRNKTKPKATTMWQSKILRRSKMYHKNNPELLHVLHLLFLFIVFPSFVVFFVFVVVIFQRNLNLHVGILFVLVSVGFQNTHIRKAKQEDDYEMEMQMCVCTLH